MASVRAVLRETEALARVGHWELDLVSGDLTWSDGVFGVFGLPREQFGGSYEAFLDLVHPDDRDAVNRAYRDSVEQRRPYRVEHRLRLPDGSVKWVQEAGRTDYDAAGRPIRSVGTIQDITESKLFERALQESEAKHRLLFESSGDGIFIVDVDGRMLAVNPTASERLGYTHAELMAMRDGAVDAPEHAVHAAERMAGILAFGSATFETVHVSRDGTLVPTEVNARRITWEGKDAIIATCRDITWRKRAEDDKARLQAQLEQAQKLESIGRLAGGVAHDFNNMLEVILGHAELALEQLDGAHPLRADLDAIRVAAGRSADLTRQLLAFARRQMVTPRVIDLNATVADTLRLLQRLIGVDIVLDWKPGVDLWPVRMDPSQVDQILANLCVNARDAIAGHGRIAIETRTATVGPEAGPEREPGEYVVLSVADDGCGMDDTTRSHIFEPFYTTKPLGKGTGLGLATVYGAVMQNRGFIDVHSAPGRGSTFTIYLPRHVERAGLDVAGEPTPDPAAAGGTVLLVEDEPALLELTNRILRTRGYTVLAAATADDAMRIARQQGAAIRLLITDIFMPGINGRELADRLRHLAPGLKVLFTSGHPADGVGPQLTAGDGAQFLQKPFTVQALAAKVREALA